MAYLKPQAPLQNGDDYVYPITTTDQVIAPDGTHRLNNELDVIRQETANIESSSTSSHSYSVGQYLVYNGLLYKVKTSIAVGNTLTPGTNLTATNVGTELKSLNDSLTPRVNGSPSCTILAEGVSLNAVYAVKVGSLLFVDLNINVTQQIPHNTPVFSISGYGVPVVNGQPSFSLSSGMNNARLRPNADGTTGLRFSSNGAIAVANYYIGTLMAFVNP